MILYKQKSGNLLIICAIIICLFNSRSVAVNLLSILVSYKAEFYLFNYNWVSSLRSIRCEHKWANHEANWLSVDMRLRLIIFRLYCCLYSIQFWDVNDKSTFRINRSRDFPPATLQLDTPIVYLVLIYRLFQNTLFTSFAEHLKRNKILKWNVCIGIFL